MSKNAIAMELSFIYCGFGQIYKGVILKGITLILLYTGLIFAFFFLHSGITLLYYINLCFIIFMWILGMLDAYFTDEGRIYKIQPLFWRWLSPCMSTVVISCSVIVIVLVFLRFDTSASYQSSKPEINTVHDSTAFTPVALNLSAGSEQAENTLMEPEAVTDTVSARLINEMRINGSQENKTFPKPERHYAAQVGVFMMKGNADRFAEKLRQKYDGVYIVPPSYRGKDNLYKIRIGEFRDKYSARKAIAMLINNEEATSGIVVRELRR